MANRGLLLSPGVVVQLDLGGRQDPVVDGDIVDDSREVLGGPAAVVGASDQQRSGIVDGVAGDGPAGAQGAVDVEVEVCAVKGLHDMSPSVVDHAGTVQGSEVAAAPGERPPSIAVGYPDPVA